MDSVIARWARGGSSFRVSIFSFWVVVYFFLNSAGLPIGLLYTSIFAPIFYLWLRKKGEKWIIYKFLIFFSPFILVHLVLGVVDIFMYVRSFLLFMSIYITIYAAAVSLQNTSKLGKIFDKIIISNLIITGLALLLLKTPYINLMWSVGIITAGVDDVTRLKLFTYEPSYYATLLVPFVVYALTLFMSNPSKRNISMVICVMIPFSLSLSFGVISVLAIAIFIAIIFKSFLIVQKPVVLFLAILVVGCVIIVFVTDNLFTIRLQNVLTGIDTSGRNRIFESTDIGYQVAQSTNLFFGAGFGQAKFYLPNLFDVYWEGLEINRLTNVLADTLATLGITGVLLRLGAEIILFFRARVYTDFFRLILFLFMFIYQFTGSYMTNVAEYVIWLLAFSPVFIDGLATTLKKKRSLLYR